MCLRRRSWVDWESRLTSAFRGTRTSCAQSKTQIMKENNMKQITSILAAGILVVSGLASARAVTNTVDLSTPLAAAQSYFTAMKSGDADPLLRTSLGSTEQKEYMVVFMRCSIAFDKLVRAATTKFGSQDADKVFGEMKDTCSMAPQALAALPNAVVKIVGTNATITARTTGSNPPDSGWKLQKAAGEWKIVMDEDVSKSDFGKEGLEASAKSAERCARNIAAGLYKTADQAQQAWLSSLKDEMHAGIPEQKVLDRFLGSWRSSLVRKIDGNPEEYKGTINFTFTRVLDGKFVQEKTESSDDTSGLAMSTFDPQKKCYRTWWFGSSGATSEATGMWDAESKTLKWSLVGGAGLTATSTHRFLDENKFEWEVTSRDQTGKVYFHMAGTSVRTGEPKK